MLRGSCFCPVATSDGRVAVDLRGVSGTLALPGEGGAPAR
jgi:hypothetical protein